MFLSCLDLKKCILKLLSVQSSWATKEQRRGWSSLRKRRATEDDYNDNDIDDVEIVRLGFERSKPSQVVKADSNCETNSSGKKECRIGCSRIAFD